MGQALPIMFKGQPSFVTNTLNQYSEIKTYLANEFNEMDLPFKPLES